MYHDDRSGQQATGERYTMSDERDRRCQYCGRLFQTPEDRDDHVPCPSNKGDLLDGPYPEDLMDPDDAPVCDPMYDGK